MSVTSEFDEFAERLRRNQHELGRELRLQYDFIVCGSGSSGSVVARRLAENPNVSVLLIEAGSSDDVPAVIQANQWPLNLGSERDWGFQGEPNPHINGRSIPYSMGKVLGGGSSINVMVWARGHKQDWDSFASAAGDPAWSYDSVLKLYRRIEDWRGTPDPDYRGAGGLVFVEPAPDPNPLAPATVNGARAIGIPTYETPNGRMMESDGGASITDVRARNGLRESIFRSYVYPYMDRPNLTVLTEALVVRVTFDGKRATGVEIARKGEMLKIAACLEVVLSLGAIHTPKVLMQSGIGDRADLERLGLPVVAHLPGVGQNLQDHVAFDCIWEYQESLPPRNTMSEAIIFWKSRSELTCPDILICEAEVPKSTPENAARFGLPSAGWILLGGVAHPRSRGRLRLSGRDPLDPVRIEANVLADMDDMKTAIACVEFCREIGNSAPLRPFVKREVMPGTLKSAELEDFVRNAATSFWHLCGTAKMGRDGMSVVDSQLKVYGVTNLRVADASIMPRITTGNTMAPCVIIGERAAEALRTDYGLAASRHELT
ncbi:glucose-methanol-choline oxidoreductase [Gluconacetobacter sacchari DSM 12717]|uniref:GMC family oxidoreductase n=2 Tax=Gluconacetobacter sacchari TaxID=92759 RepID=A0A7W4NS29_9PROT|nr:GMC family oxidoreductase N-terminal domain-containing protein [Gluconacetobacter sacchari]MBB2161653.1 GMC family oxidoreductase [Gluconacetobacter sacchari]GBQ19167.1 glucose-methanol-choline oxidoreductase [Gluconacetobacter sacchari DSM 12717]